jgi:hypothetical protein
MASLTDEQLAATVTRTEPGWPRLEDFPVRECLLTVLNEEWQHRRYAERDLTAHLVRETELPPPLRLA